jgi:hypothetical protein
MKKGGKILTPSLRNEIAFSLLQTYMDRSFEEIRSEVLELDSESQRRLRDEIDRNLESDHTGFHEAKRRSEAVDRGEMKTVDGPEALNRVRKSIAR